MKPLIRLLLATLAALLAASCYEVPVTGRRALNAVDDAEVTKMSIAMFDDMKRRNRLSKNRDYNDRLQRIGERLSKVVFWDMPDADWEFVVFEAPQINAFAMAGGKVGVFTGLFKIAKTDDQLASVIAHEIAHVTAKHVHEKLSREMAVNTVGVIGMVGLGASGAVSPIAADALGQVYGIGTTLGGFAFDRDKEKEADYIGLIYMARAGYNPEEAVKVLEALETEEADAPTPPALLSTHPTHPERILALMDAMPKAKAEAQKAAVTNTPVLVK